MNLPETATETTPAIIAAAVTGKAKKTPAASTSNPRTNPYKRGNYVKMFQWIMDRKGKPFAISELLEFAKTLTDKDGNPLKETAIRASVTVIMSPRLKGRTMKDGSTADNRGSSSAEGHVYFMHPVALDYKDKPEDMSKRDFRKANRKFSLRWREPMLDPLFRKDADGKPMTPKRKAKAEKATPASKTAKTAKTDKTAKTGKGKGKATPAKPAAKPTTTSKPSKAKGKAVKTSFNASADGYKAEPETPVDAPAASETPAPAAETATA